MLTDGEILTVIAGFSVTIATVFFLWLQIHKQTKVNSARFTIDYIDKILRENKDVVTILHERVDSNRPQFESDRAVRVFMNGLENAIKFSNDGIIEKPHLLNMLRITFKMIREDSEVKRIMDEAYDKDEGAFKLLRDYLTTDF